jgi:hypothetical protein
MKKIIVAILMTSLMLMTTSSAVSVNTFTAEQQIDPTLYNHPDNTGVERWAVLVGAAGDWGSDDYGNDDYDVFGLNDTLVNHGWQVDHIKVLVSWDTYDANSAIKENIINAIRWMGAKEDEDDIVLFFFSGHGVHKKIISFDNEIITIDELGNEFDNFESKNIVLIFNSCHSGSMISSSFVSSESTEEQIEEQYDYENLIYSDGSLENILGQNIENEQISIEGTDLESSGSNGLNKPGRVILTSCRGYEYTLAGFLNNTGAPIKNTIFPYFLIKGFDGEAKDANQDGWISAEEAFKYAKPQTIKYSWPFQHPQIYDGHEGDINIVQISSQASQSSSSSQQSSQSGSTTQQSTTSTATSTSISSAATTNMITSIDSISKSTIR